MVGKKNPPFILSAETDPLSRYKSKQHHDPILLPRARMESRQGPTRRSRRRTLYTSSRCVGRCMGREYHVAKPRSTCYGPHSQVFGYVVFWSRGMSLSIFLYYQLYICVYTNHHPLPPSFSPHIVSLRHHPRPPLRSRQGILTKRCRATGHHHLPPNILFHRSR